MDGLAKGYNGSSYWQNRYDVKLAEQYQRFASGSLPNLEMRTAQVALLFLGYASGKIDGVIGPRTRAAIKNCAFRHRDYLIFWCGLLLGHTGTLIQTTAQSWLLFQLTNAPFYLGLEGLCLGLPRVLFSALGGAIVDRADRKIILSLPKSRFCS